MSHDWTKALDDHFVEVITDGLLDRPNFLVPTGHEILHSLEVAQPVIDRINREVREDVEKVEQACEASQGTGCGVLVVKKSSRVVEVEVSACVPSGSIYMIERDGLDAFLDRNAEKAPYMVMFEPDMRP